LTLKLAFFTVFLETRLSGFLSLSEFVANPFL
jgi:hypothetical protein